MPKNHITGWGRMRPGEDIPIERLHLDPNNPRLPESAIGKKEEDLLRILYSSFNLDELAQSMSNNGYFDEEPIVAIPIYPKNKESKLRADLERFKDFIKDKSTEFIVVEGNRRLATAKLLLNSELRSKVGVTNWPTLSKEVRIDLQKLPTIVYSNRQEVIPYLGVRHIVGIQKWDSYAKARYVVKMIKENYSVEQVEQIIGDKQSVVRKNYLAHGLLEQVDKEFEYDTKNAKENFSLLLLALGQGKIKRYLSLPGKLSDTNYKKPVSENNLDKLYDIFSWIFGDRKHQPVITESRDITNYLSYVVASTEAVSYLKTTRNLADAYDRTDGEETMVLKYLRTADSKLSGALGVIHRHKTDEVKLEVKKIEETVERIVKTVI